MVTIAVNTGFVQLVQETHAVAQVLSSYKNIQVMGMASPGEVGEACLSVVA